MIDVEPVSLPARVRRFMARPWSEQKLAVRRKVKKLVNRVLPGAVLPVRLPFGAWWLATSDVASDAIYGGSFESAETRFVARYLRSGMTVLDIGAHHGYYTLLAARSVGASGRVVAFEPSGRERARLLRHLRLNRMSWVEVEDVALGEHDEEVDLYRVDGRETGCNSLRPPNVLEPTSRERVRVTTLDAVLAKRDIRDVDFVKIDVEGAERAVLAGGASLLGAARRPIILVEVADQRTRPWGYAAREILDTLARAGFRWHALAPDGALRALAVGDDQSFNDNFVAVPLERTAELG